DLEMEDVLAVDLEAEVARLDHAGVHRPDRHFVQLLARHREEALLQPRAHRLEARMTERAHLPLAEDLALEAVHLRAAARGRGGRLPDVAPQPLEPPRLR